MGQRLSLKFLGGLKMEKHFLVTVSEQKEALHAIRFIGSFFNEKNEIKITLFYTASRYGSPSSGKEALAKAKEMLVFYGFSTENILLRHQRRRSTKIMDIVYEGERGLYDAVILGRRGISWLEEAFDESVTRGVLEKEATFPIWISRNPDLNRKNILLCLDGSKESERIVDHAGFVLSKERIHKIVLLSVFKSIENSTAEFLNQGKKILTDYNIPEELIEEKVIKGSSPAKYIMELAESGAYAVVGTGRQGKDQGRNSLHQLFMGSVSTYLFKNLKGATLWISR